MTLGDFNKFKKLMAQTTSSNENEAIIALRVANAILERNGLTWERVLDRSIKIELPFEEIDEWRR